MNTQFFERPILNSAYRYSSGHGKLDELSHPLPRIIDRGSRARFITPVPGLRAQKWALDQASLLLGYIPAASINCVRQQVHRWREIPEAAPLLQRPRHHCLGDLRPSLWQIEAVETVIQPKTADRTGDDLETSTAEPRIRDVLACPKRPDLIPRKKG